MIYEALNQRVATPYFFSYELVRLFPGESAHNIRVQLSRFAKRGLLERLKNGVYAFADRPVDELVLASILYRPSYVSLETALNLYGVIPDIPAIVTSVTSVTSNTFTTRRGTYSYSRLATRLFFGFNQQTDPQSGLAYSLAEPEKALLDWLYLRRLTQLTDQRLDAAKLNRRRLLELSTDYPSWVRKALP